MLSAIVNGESYNLDDGTLSFLVGDDGWGMSPLHRLSQRGPLQHGETDKGFRLDPRIASIVLFLRGNSRQDLYDLRSQILDIFAPSNSPIKLRWTLNDIRQIDCYFDKNMSMSSSDRPGFSQRVAITLRCPDPTFYDPAGAATTFGLGGGSDDLAIPLEVPMLVGGSKIDSTKAIAYGGNWRSYPHLIRITGPIDDCIITNNSTGEVLDFTGVTISNGDYYDINLTYGNKTVIDSSGNNKIADLSDDSDLGTWHLGAEPEVDDGLNSINVTGNTITQTTKVEINYFERFLGR